MSGNNERLPEDIPTCPLCGEKPWFWILNIRGAQRGWFWLFSEEYLSRDNHYKKLHLGEWPGFPPTLENVSKVTCRMNNGRLSVIQHVFYPDEPEFEAVINAAKKYWDVVGGRRM